MDNLNQKEEKYIAKIHWSNLIGPALIAAITIPYVFMLPILTILGFVPLLKRIIENRFILYSMNSESVFIENGVLSKLKKEIPLRKINDIEFSQNIFQRFFGVGNILLMTGNDKPICLQYIPAVDEFKTKLSANINKK
jgi:uncharacterized membrane protein YdbT with pleckstrin-like domain